MLDPRSDSTSTASILHIAPVPAFVAYDRFHHDLDATEVLGRILSLDVTDVDIYKRAIELLLCILLGQYAAEGKLYMLVEEVFQPCPPEARTWATWQFRATHVIMKWIEVNR